MAPTIPHNRKDMQDYLCNNRLRQAMKFLAVN